MQSHSVPCLAFCGELPRAVQTVPRAEIAAAQFAAALGQARAAYVHRLYSILGWHHPRHAAEVGADIDAKALPVLRRLVCIAFEDTEANPRRKGRKRAQAAQPTRRTAPLVSWGFAALGGQLPAVLAAPVQAAERPDSVSLDFLASPGDERRPGLTQGEEEPIDGLFSPEQADDEALGPVALQPERVLAGSTEEIQTALIEEADRGPGQALTLELAALGTGLLPRGGFESRAHWLLMVAYRALVAKGHSVVVEGFPSTWGVAGRGPRCVNDALPRSPSAKSTPG